MNDNFQNCERERMVYILFIDKYSLFPCFFGAYFQFNQTLMTLNKNDHLLTLKLRIP